MGRLDGKVAIVTGAARGTGEATARLFAAEGAKVVIGDILEDQGQAVADDLGDATVFGLLDVTSEEDWDRVVLLAAERFGSLSVLVNNAAVLHIAAIVDTTPADFRRVLDVNQVGPFLGIRAATPAMEAAGGGSIVNVSSIDGLEGGNGLSAYASTKWGLRGLTKVAALELGRLGIRVNTMLPGGGSWEMVKPWFEKFAAEVPAGASFGGPRALGRSADLSELAQAILFLASDESSFCTGADLAVDGGHTAGVIFPGVPGYPAD